MGALVPFKEKGEKYVLKDVVFCTRDSLANNSTSPPRSVND